MSIINFFRTFWTTLNYSKEDKQQISEPISEPAKNSLIGMLSEAQANFKALNSYTQDLEKINEVLVDRLKGANLDYHVRRFFAPVAIEKRLEQLKKDRIIHIPVHKNGEIQ